MKKGLVFGKFMPLHKGHLALIEFARKQCDNLLVLLCASGTEPIPGEVRLAWLQTLYGAEPGVEIRYLSYDEGQLPNTSVSSREVSRLWATRFTEELGSVDLVITSEPYGEYLAEYLRIQHVPFDGDRRLVPVSASLIRQKPFRYWEYLPEVAKPYFVKKVCITGTESTGKSTLTGKLARHYHTVFVPEMARQIIEVTQACTFDDLATIAACHAREILIRLPEANKLLFCDTDVRVTQSYARFLFNRPLPLLPWIETANQFDLHLFLENDAPYHQDGTRLDKTERDRLSAFHRAQLRESNVPFVSISGNWTERLDQACRVVDERIIQPNT